MKINYSITLLLTSIITSTYAINLEIPAIGDGEKNKFYDTIHPSINSHKFPALYIYNTKKQKFLSTKEASLYFSNLSEQEFWPLLIEQWAKDTHEFSTSNDLLSKSLPILKLDKEYIIFYDNLPKTMLEQFKSMDPELTNKDKEVKIILSQLENARSYTVY
jgi:hypothetical protein